ncbi:MAG: DUF3488 and transglutaminase-like domain-containing protein [Verrucomicrobiota bacterium]|nr:DUF3488 and transglutaminase-like domain-containing protein [Verrucomicrobiota bacterium]
MSAASTRVRLNPEELYQLKWLTGGLLTLLSIWTLPFIDSSYLLVVLAVVGIVGTVLVYPSLPTHIPALAWKIATPLVIVLMLTDFILSRPDVLPPLIRLIAMLTIVRALAYRTRREDLQLVMLCLFMVVVSGVLSVSIAFAFQILLFAPVAMLVLFLVTLTDCTDRPEQIQVESWSHFRWSRFRSRIHGAFDMKLVGFVGMLFAALTLMSAGIFAIMPRFRLDQAIPFFKLKTSQSLSGFSDSIQFGDVTDIMEDDAVAFRVDLSDGIDRPETPYWRMVVLDEYTGAGYRMSRSAKSRNRLVTDNQFLQSSASKRTGTNDGRWTFYYEGSISRYLPTVGLPRRLRFQIRQTLETNQLLALNALNELTGAVTFYQLENVELADFQLGKGDDLVLKDASPVAYLPKNETSPTILKYPMTTLAVPSGITNEAALGRIVQAVTAGEQHLPAPIFTEKLLGWLHQRHAYSLKSTVPSGEGDRLLRWAESNEPGHCELFAGSFAIIARAAGYPTRIVTGFVGGAWNGYENYYMIRNRDAHAWVELYDEVTHRWVRVDPTPGGRLSDQNNTAIQTGSRLFIDRTIGAYLDSLRVLWYRRIVNFDAEQQLEIANSFKQQFNSFSEAMKARLKAWKESVQAFFKAPWDRQRWLEAGGVAGVILAGLLLGRGVVLFFRWQRRRRQGTRGEIVWSWERRKAGNLAGKFRQRGLNEQPEMAPLYRNLMTIRFGREAEWPPVKTVLREARNRLRKK